MTDADKKPVDDGEGNQDTGPLQLGDGHNAPRTNSERSAFTSDDAEAARAHFGGDKPPRSQAATAFNRAWRRLGFRIAQGVGLLFSGIWAGCILMSGVSAALTFKTIPTYEPSVGASPYSDPAFAEQAPRVIAGGVAQEIFKAMDVVQLACIAAVVAAAGLQATAFRRFLVKDGRSMAQVIRLLCLLAAVGIFAYSTTLREPMHTLREQLYDTAITEPVREKVRTRFDSYHKTSERLAGYTFVLVIASALAAPFAATTEPHRRA